MIVVDKEKYKMAVYEAKKEVHVQIIGFIKAALVEQYLKDLEETVARVQKTTFTLVFDATYQSPLPSKVSTELGETLMFYASLGFKDIFIVNPASKIAYVQVRNALETVNFPGTVVDNVSQLPIR